MTRSSSKEPEACHGDSAFPRFQAVIGPWRTGCCSWTIAFHLYASFLQKVLPGVFPAAIGTGSQTMTSVKRLGDNALLTWHLGTVAMGLQASLLLQKVEALCWGQWKSEMVQEGRAPLVPALAPASPLVQPSTI